MRRPAWWPRWARALRVFQPGDRVIVFHHIPCGKCFYCQRKLYAQCPVYKKVGVTAGYEPAGGGFSQYVRAMDWIVERGVEKIPGGRIFRSGVFCRASEYLPQRRQAAGSAAGRCGRDSWARTHRTDFHDDDGAHRRADRRDRHHAGTARAGARVRRGSGVRSTRIRCLEQAVQFDDRWARCGSGDYRGFGAQGLSNRRLRALGRERESCCLRKPRIRSASRFRARMCAWASGCYAVPIARRWICKKNRRDLVFSGALAGGAVDFASVSARSTSMKASILRCIPDEGSLKIVVQPQR